MRVLAAVLAAVVCVGGVLAFYRWTATSTGQSTSFHAAVSYDRYNEQVDAFEAGRLDLMLPVPPGLATLHDPYDPAANAPFRKTGYQDLAYRDGKLFIYWGPTPALTLVWPARALGLGRVPQTYQVAFFAALAFLCAAGLMWTLTRRLVPRTPVWMLLAGVLALGGGGLWPWLIRRPDVYEVAIAAASAFLFAGLWLLALGGLGTRVRRVPIALAGLCFGLAIGARPSMAFGLIVPLGWLVWRYRRDPYQRWVRTAAALAVPVIACGVALMIYNDRRFGSPLDFGRGYLLLSPDDAAKGASLVNLPAGLWFYLFGRLNFIPAFPYFHVELPGGAPFAVPSTWLVSERAGGLLTMQPIVLALLGIWPLWRRLRPVAITAALLAAVGVVLLVFDSYYVNGVLQRYEVDFVPPLLVASLLCWFGLRATEPRAVVRAAVTWSGAFLALLGAVAGALLSMTGPYATLPRGWEHIAPHMTFLAPLARSFGWQAAVRELWTLAALLAGVAAVSGLTALAVRRTGVDQRGRASAAGVGAALAGVAAVLLAILLPRADAANAGFGTGRSVALVAGLALLSAGGTLAILAAASGRARRSGPSEGPSEPRRPAGSPAPTPPTASPA